MSLDSAQHWLEGELTIYTMLNGEGSEVPSTPTVLLSVPNFDIIADNFWSKI